VKGIIVDIDNTIAPYNQKVLKPEIKKWFFNLEKRGFKICLVSNSLKERVDFFSSRLEIPAVDKAIKPSKRGFLKAVNILNISKENIIVIGDQIFTDIWGGNRAGLKTILVNPMDKNEFIFTKFMRLLEKFIFTRKYSREENI